MIINIQLNFTSGIGDFYTFFCEIYFTAKQLKKLGHDVHLHLNLKSEIDFLNIFLPQYYECFYKIFIDNQGKTLKDFQNHKIQYPHNAWQPGIHCWEMFVPNDFNANNLKQYFFNWAHRQLNYEELNNFPQLSEKIVNNTFQFKEQCDLQTFDIIHFRELDNIAYIDNDRFSKNSTEFKNTYSNLLNTINNISNNKQIFICSNSVSIKQYFKNHCNNIHIYQEDLSKTINRNYTNNQYFDFCLNEFCLMSMCDKIHTFTNYGWVSNFLIYGALHNKFGVTNPYKNDSFIKQYGHF